MTILPSCLLCSKPFTPRNFTQLRCPSCVLKSKSCEVCGTKKNSPGPCCKKCNSINKFGKPNLKNRCEEKPIEQIVAEAESLGLLPEKQYAFGYVIGVVFGDGSISKDVHNNLKRSDGTVRPRPVTLYRVRLQVTEQVFIERFVTHWTILTSKVPTIMTSTRTDFSKSTLNGRRNEYNVQLFTVGPRHALFGRYLAHLKYERHPSKLLDLPLEVTRGFIHGMIDSEGYVRPEYTDITNKNIELLNTLVTMFEKL